VARRRAKTRVVLEGLALAERIGVGDDELAFGVIGAGARARRDVDAVYFKSVTWLILPVPINSISALVLSLRKSEAGTPADGRGSIINLSALHAAQTDRPATNAASSLYRLCDKSI